MEDVKRRNLVAEWNITCGKPAPTDKIARNTAIMKQALLVIEELNEVIEAIENDDDNNLLKELADVKVVTDGLYFLSGMPVEEAFERVMEDNNKKYDLSMDYVSSRFKAMGYDPQENSIMCVPAGGGSYTHSIHRASDDKVCKLVKHKELDFSDLIG